MELGLMGFYDDMQGVATDLLDTFKQGTVTLSRTVAGTVDPAEPFIPVAGTTTVYTLKATVKAVSKKFIDGTTIMATDKEVTCAVFAVDPAPGDILSIDGVAVTVIKTIRLPAAGTAVAHKFIVRG